MKDIDLLLVIGGPEKELLMSNFKRSFYRYKTALSRHSGDTFSLVFSFTGQGGMELTGTRGGQRGRWTGEVSTAVPSPQGHHP